MNQNLKDYMDESTVKIVTDRLHNLHEDVNELKDSMKESMKEMSTAVTKLVLLEERNTQVVRLVERLMKEIDDSKVDAKDLREKVNKLEQQAPTNALTTSWVSAALYGMACLCAMFIAKATGLI